MFAKAFQGVGSDYGLLVLRVVFGALLLAGHGTGKLQSLLAGRGRSGPFGMEGLFPQFLITFAEFFCSILIILGLATPLAAIPVIIGMMVAVFWGHAADPWFPVRNPVVTASGETIRVASSARELAFLYGAAFTTLFFTGAGRFSLDAMFSRSFGRKRTSPDPLPIRGEMPTARR